MSLSNDFTQIRKKINNDVRDERGIALCHTTINQAENKVKKAIKELIKELDKNEFPYLDLFVKSELKEIFGEDLVEERK